MPGCCPSPSRKAPACAQSWSPGTGMLRAGRCQHRCVASDSAGAPGSVQPRAGQLATPCGHQRSLHDMPHVMHAEYPVPQRANIAWMISVPGGKALESWHRTYEMCARPGTGERRADDVAVLHSVLTPEPCRFKGPYRNLQWHMDRSLNHPRALVQQAGCLDRPLGYRTMVVACLSINKPGQ